MIRVDDLTRHYGDVTALRDVDLTVRDRGVHALVGTNGSGKTTLLRAILGLVAPSGGRIERDGSVSAAFQRPSFYETLTVAENLEAFGALVGADADRVWAVAGRLGLDPVRDRVAGDLSGGYARKLDLALALAREPDHLLLDEPLGDLDDATARELIDVVASYADGHAVLVSTHDLPAFAPHVDHLTVLRDGRVALDAPREELPEGARELRSAYLAVALDDDDGGDGERATGADEGERPGNGTRPATDGDRSDR